MKKILMLASVALLAASCQESLEDRAAREARDFTRKNCPVKQSDVITTDSLVFDKATLTLHYCLSLSGAADTTAIRKDELRRDMVKALKGNTSIKKYKEAGYNFRYTFYSTKHKGMTLYDVNITKKDYTENNKPNNKE